MRRRRTRFVSLYFYRNIRRVQFMLFRYRFSFQVARQEPHRTIAKHIVKGLKSGQVGSISGFRVIQSGDMK